MGKKRKTAQHRFGMQVVTLCISTTMVLILIGLVVLSALSTHKLSEYVREHLTVTVMLNDSVTVKESRDLCRQLAAQPYAKRVQYISKEQALKEQTEAMGSDPSEFLGVNPFTATIELQVYADYANGDSLFFIADGLKLHHKEVTEVAYQEDLTDKVNTNLQRVSILLLSLAAACGICIGSRHRDISLEAVGRTEAINTQRKLASGADIR